MDLLSAHVCLSLVCHCLCTPQAHSQDVCPSETCLACNNTDSSMKREADLMS